MRTKIGMILVMLALSAALSGCGVEGTQSLNEPFGKPRIPEGTTTTPSPAYAARYPLCAGLPAGFLGCK
jgi:hypothetical protein